MTDSITTRIKLPKPVHKRVKAEAAFADVNLDEALGMCISHMINGLNIVPLSWLPGYESPDDDDES